MLPGSTLANMYVKCGALAKAQELCENLPARNIDSWNALITLYAQQGHAQHALSCFEQMQLEGPPPDAVTFACILKVCGILGHIDMGQALHLEIVTAGILEKDIVLGNALISMYAKCGLLEEAQEVLNNLQVTNVVSWSALLAGYVQHGHSEEALKCFEQMQLKGVSPNAVTLVSIFKACGSIGAAAKGQEIHTKIDGDGFIRQDIFVGTALVDMYAKCGLLAKAKEVFVSLPARNVVTWSALIAGYAQHGHGENALDMYAQMRCEGFFPNRVTFVSVLKACASIQAVGKGQEIEAEIVQAGFLERDIVIGNALVNLYAKCGLFAKAQVMFDNLSVPDVVSWSALINGYAQHGHAEQALTCYERMHLLGLSPNAATFVSVLKACGSIGGADKGHEIHAQIAEEGLLEKENFLGNALVDMYAKCSLVAKSQVEFEKLHVRDIISWNALITGYAHHGKSEEALKCYEWMQVEGLSPDEVTLACILKACGSIGAANKGQEVHAKIVAEGLLETEIAVGNALVDMYAKCGLLAEAQKTFDKLPLQDIVSWNALIAGYAQNGHGEKAVQGFERMKLEGLLPDAVTFVCVLKAYGSIGAADQGQKIHAVVAREGLLEYDIFVGSELVVMYAKCGLLAKAQEVFDGLLFQDVVLWSILIIGYTDHGFNDEALRCFECMQCRGQSPNAVTLVAILKACGSIGVLCKGQNIHAAIAKEGVLKKDIFVGNALIGMYAKCGSLAKAQEVCDELPARDVMSWNGLIAGYAQHGHPEGVINCYDCMQLDGIYPDSLTIVYVMKACGVLGSACKGQYMHFEVVRGGLLETNLVVCTALVGMYAKCGFLAKAQEVFDTLPAWDVVLWNVLVGAYSMLGKIEHVSSLIGKMLDEGIKPDLATFLSILNTCSHAGLLDVGQVYFEAMSLVYGLTPTLEHHTCMVDLFCRSGCLDKAYAVIKKMPFSADLTMWHTVLGACQRWGHMTLGRLAFEHAVQLEVEDAAAYVYMSNFSF